jgi:uncharacterized protein YbaR (Trm112 family)
MNKKDLVQKQVIICPNCKGELKRFLYMESENSKIGQYKCNECYRYYRIINKVLIDYGIYNLFEG